MYEKRCYLNWLKDSLFFLGLALIIAAAVMFIAVPVRKMVQQEGRINTYHVQAIQAATPGQFAVALRGLDQALQREEMVQGNAVAPFLGAGEDDEMAYKRAQYLALAQRADALASSVALTSTETSTGMAEMKVTLLATPTNSYSFWVWRQGGTWWQFYWPAILIVSTVVIWVVGSMVPDYFTRTVRVNGAMT